MMPLPNSLPYLAKSYAAAYDPHTGGYLAPAPSQISTPFTPADVAAWRTNYSSQPMYDCVELEVASMLYTLVRMTGAKAILETGCSRGFSASFLGAGVYDNGGGQVITIDIQNRFHYWEGSTEVSPLIQFIQKDSQHALNEIEGIEFDFMFLDSLHTYQHLMTEIMIFDHLLKIGGSIVLHDTMHYDALGAVVSSLKENPRFDLVTLPSPRKHHNNTRCPGITILTKYSDDREKHPIKLSQKHLHLGENSCAKWNDVARDKTMVPYYDLLRNKELL